MRLKGKTMAVNQLPPGPGEITSGTMIEQPDGTFLMIATIKGSDFLFAFDVTQIAPLPGRVGVFTGEFTIKEDSDGE